MDDPFEVTEHQRPSYSREESLRELCQQLWEARQTIDSLENKVLELEGKVQEQAFLLRRQQDKESAFLKEIASVVDECDDTLHIEEARLSVANPEDPATIQSRKWFRKVDRVRWKLMDALSFTGVSLRMPSGKPDLEMDAIHSVAYQLDTPDGEIVRVLRPGLLWNSNLLRHALVVVSASDEVTPLQLELDSEILIAEDWTDIFNGVHPTGSDSDDHADEIAEMSDMH